MHSETLAQEAQAGAHYHHGLLAQAVDKTFC